MSRGLQMAGFEVVGVDKDPQPHYLRGPGAHGAVFVQADALAYLGEVIAGRHGHFDLIHASPPCQAHSSLRHLHKHIKYVDLIPETRALLQRWGGPWMLENVPGAPLGGANLTMLCGTMFGLQTPDGRAELRRHRLFETSFSVPLRPACQHGHVGLESVSVTGTGMGVGGRTRWKERRALSVAGGTAEAKKDGWSGRSGGKEAALRETFSVDDARAAMGIDWLPMSKLSQAIPPAYAEWLGLQAIDHIRHTACSKSLSVKRGREACRGTVGRYDGSVTS